jgi:23S rRNA pseudouridine2605 synthase
MAIIGYSDMVPDGSRREPKEPMPEERLQKIMARAGVASRRACEELISQGRVSINGVKAEVGAKADPDKDAIRVDGEILKPRDTQLVYIILNKPQDVVSAVSAQEQETRQTVLDLVDVPQRIYPVGRLDADSEGLLLLTNDGELTQQLTHPRYGHKKTYRVLVKGKPSAQVLEQWAAGVELDDGKTSPCEVRVHRETENATWIEVTMGEGRKRQIRRTAAALHLYVLRLIRIQIGNLQVHGLKPGEWRYLENHEVRKLKKTSAAREGRPYRGGGSHRGGPQANKPRRRRPAGSGPASNQNRASRKPHNPRRKGSKDN